MGTTAIREHVASTSAKDLGDRTRRRSLPLSGSERRILLAAGDAIAAVAAFESVQLIWHVVVPGARWAAPLAGLVFALGWIAALYLVDAYDVEIPASRVRSFVVVLKATLVMGVAALFVFFAAPYWVPRPVVILSLLGSTITVSAMRWTLSRALLHRAFARRAIVIGGIEGPGIAQALASARYEYQVIGAVDDGRGDLDGLTHLGSIDELSTVVKRYRVHEVILSRAGGYQRRDRAAELCLSLGIRVVTPLDLVERYQGRVPLDGVDSAWFLSLPPHDLYARPYLVARRLVDLFLSAVVSAPFLLILPILAAVIKLDSRGPVFFTQRRVGQYGREFRLIKLRTMIVDAERHGHRWAERADSRVTRAGRLLRATRLDEVPQVLNVLRGEMSFIGPRPERPEFVTQLETVVPYYRVRLAVKPGISGWAQVKNGYAASVADSAHKLEYDLYYVKNQCLRLDLQIVFHTIFTVLGFRGR